MKASVKVIDHGLKELKRQLKALLRNPSYVKAGLLGAGGNAKRADGALTNTELGIIHEFGTSRLPPRPFISPAFQKGKPEYLRMLITGAKARGSLHEETARERTLNIIGMKIAADMKAYIATNQVKPPSRGEGKTTLIDTGRMMNSITYVVVTRDGKALKSAATKSGPKATRLGSPADIAAAQARGERIFKNQFGTWAARKR